MPMFSRLDRRFAESARSTGINLICFLSDLCLRPFFLQYVLIHLRQRWGGDNKKKEPNIESL